MAAAAAKHVLEIAEELRRAVPPEFGGAAHRLLPLILIVERARNRVMSVVDLHEEVGNGELQLVRPQPAGLVARGKPEARPKIVQDQRGLRDHELAGLQKRRGVGRMRRSLAIEQPHHCGHTARARPSRHVDVVGAAFFERKPHEFAAALDRRPVVELIAHGSPRNRSHPCGNLAWRAASAEFPAAFGQHWWASGATAAMRAEASGIRFFRCPAADRRGRQAGRSPSPPPADEVRDRNPKSARERNQQRRSARTRAAGPAHPNSARHRVHDRSRRDFLGLQRRLQMAGRDLPGGRGAVHARLSVAAAVQRVHPAVAPGSACSARGASTLT